MIGLLQDVAFQVPQRTRRFEPEVIDEVFTGAAQDVQCRRLMTGPVQRGREQPGGNLPTRVIAG